MKHPYLAAFHFHTPLELFRVPARYRDEIQIVIRQLSGEHEIIRSSLRKISESAYISALQILTGAVDGSDLLSNTPCLDRDCW